MIRLDHTDNRIQIPAESIIPNTTLGNFVMPMVGFSEGSLVANLKSWARRPARKEQIVAKQSRRRSTSQHPTTTDDSEAKQSRQRASSVSQSLAATAAAEQSQRRSTESQSLAATAEAEQNRRESVPKTLTAAAETEQRQRTSFVAQHPAITPD
jgi:SLT domain-containing protein